MLRTPIVHSILQGALLVAVGAPPSPSPPPPPAPKPLALERIASATGETWPGPQFVQADRKGNAILLRGDDLRVFRLRPGAPLEPDGALADARPTGDPPLRAVLNASGDEWLLFDGRGPRLYHAGKSKDLPSSDWSVRSIGFRGGTPVLGVGVTMRRTAAAVTHPPSTPPLLIEKRSDSWAPLVEEALAEVGEGEDFHAAQMTARDVLVLEGAEGHLWVANQYGYRLRHFSPGGRLLDEILVKGGRPEELPTALAAELREELAKAAAKYGRGAVAIAISARRSVQCMSLGLDGRLYLFAGATSDGKAAHLDRFDPSERRLERLELALPADAAEEIATMAALKEGLVLATFRGDRGRFFVGWEALDKARWTEVPKVEVR